MSGNETKRQGTLYVVGTPIGNLRDLSPRAAEVLANVNVIAAEDTRHTRGLLSSIGAKNELIAYHDHSDAQRAGVLLERLAAGDSVALVSDAGMPTISDPGLPLIRQARAIGVDVVGVPGPCAVTAALSISGLPSDRFVFEGFLPRKTKQRSERLRELRAELRTMIFFESVHRLTDALDALSLEFGEERPAAIARELTKLHEACYTGSLASLRARLGADIPLKGEFVVLVAGSGERLRADEAEFRRVYDVLLVELPPKQALALAVEITGLPRNEAYRLVRLTS